MKKKHIWIFICLYALWILSNSLWDGTSSGNASSGVTAFLMRLINHAGFSISFDLLHHYVRKLAHFSEYALLGFLVCTGSHIDPSPKAKIRFFTFLLVTPFLDETIQLFVPDRAGSIKDVLIDMSGYLAGALFLYILLCIVKDINNRQADTQKARF